MKTCSIWPRNIRAVPDRGCV